MNFGRNYAGAAAASCLRRSARRRLGRLPERHRRKHKRSDQGSEPDELHYVHSNILLCSCVLLISGSFRWSIVATTATTTAARGARRSYIGHELFHRSVASPRDSAKQGLLDLGIGEIGVCMALH